ncbi:MAG TPA: winged helix domain-containing protein, partial [Polyangia bacterium]|nr:winged helix domain-containing protein [Polyangia bacterium]
IGFLAPSHDELAQSFLGYLGGTLATAFSGDTLLAAGDRAPTKAPLALPAPMLTEVASVLDGLRWDRALTERFVGCFLTRPKPHVVFTPPARPLSPDAFAQRLATRGRLTLALPTRGLVQRNRIFCNGEAHDVDAATARAFTTLVHDRTLPLPLKLRATSEELLYGWYEAGYLRIDKR